jgi:hypothetical protein
VVAVESGPRDGAEVRGALSNGEPLAVDHVVLATGYKDGFPMLDEGFGSSLEGLYIRGYAATHDFDVRRPAVPAGAAREEVFTELVRGDVFYWGPLMAGALLGSIPVALVYSLFVEHYVTALTGAVKG